MFKVGKVAEHFCASAFMYTYISHQTSACLFRRSVSFNIIACHRDLHAFQIGHDLQSLSFEGLCPSQCFIPPWPRRHLGASRQTTQANSVSDLLWLKPLPRPPFLQAFTRKGTDWNCWLELWFHHVLWKLWKCVSKVDFPQFPERMEPLRIWIGCQSTNNLRSKEHWVYRWRHFQSFSTSTTSCRNH